VDEVRESIVSLDAPAQAQILGGNAITLYGLE
jgi:hypothetical protein